MKRRLTILALTSLAVVALVGVALMFTSRVQAGGATQIEGLAEIAGSECNGEVKGPDGQDWDFALILMTGDLAGCHYVFVEEVECSPS